jgi:hypothetical protein
LPVASPDTLALSRGRGCCWSPGVGPAPLAWAADLDLGRPPADAFTRLRVRVRRRHRATRACASASCTRDRSRLPNQSDSRGHYGHDPGSDDLCTTGPAVAPPPRFPWVARPARRDVGRAPLVRFVPLQHMPAAMRCPMLPRIRTIPLRRFSLHRPAPLVRTFHGDTNRPCGFTPWRSKAVPLVVADVRAWFIAESRGASRA